MRPQMTLWWRSRTSVRNEGLGSTENWHSTKVPKVNNVICKVWSASVKFRKTLHFWAKSQYFFFATLLPKKFKIQDWCCECGSWNCLWSKSWQVGSWPGSVKHDAFTKQTWCFYKTNKSWFCKTWCLYKTNKCGLCQTWCFYKTNKCCSSGNPPELIVFAFFNNILFKKNRAIRHFQVFCQKTNVWVKSNK